METHMGSKEQKNIKHSHLKTPITNQLTSCSPPPLLSYWLFMHVLRVTGSVSVGGTFGVGLCPTV